MKGLKPKPIDDAELEKLDNKRDSSWPLVLFYIHLNILGAYGFFVLFTSTSLLTVIFTFILSFLGVIGATAGAHRLWAHRTYTANQTLRVFLMLCQTLAGQGSIYSWVRSHRLHHQKYKTDDDPFYSNKDFFSAQVLAQIQTYSKRQEKLLETIDMSDIEEDKVVMFQHKFYWILYIILCALLPINAPLEYWDDTVSAAIFVTYSLRYLFVLNICWLINSGHIVWGLDKDHKASDSNMIFLITKSYWPHYHYLLPCDYQTGEFGDYGEDCTSAFIRVAAALGLATDLQTVTSKAVRDGLTAAVDTDKPVVECIRDEAMKELERIPSDHYLTKSLPPHHLLLKIGSSVIWLRNIHSPRLLCNGTRLINGKYKEEDVLLPPIPMIPNDTLFQFKRLQFPIRLAFAMTTNKAQGQPMQICRMG